VPPAATIENSAIVAVRHEAMRFFVDQLAQDMWKVTHGAESLAQFLENIEPCSVQGWKEETFLT
jgi:hypothetical protein